MKKYILFSVALLCLLTNSVAQNLISGVIRDDVSGENLPFIYLQNVTTQAKTVTDFKGFYSLEAEIGKDSIRVTGFGYQTQVYLAGNDLNIQLKAKNLILDEVIISANRDEEKKSESPIAISTVRAKTIEENKPITIDQVLNQTPGVNMVDLGNEQHTMSIRRQIDYGASYLYLEDGVPIRASGVFNHNALIEINMANVSKIEIIRGPASSIYGGESIGGAVNFISKKPSYKPSAYVSLQGNNIGYKRIDFTASNTFKEKLGLRFSGYYSDKTDGVVEYTDFNKLALSFSANYQLTKNSELVWSNDYVDYFSEMSGSLDSADFYSKSYESNQTFTNRKVNAFRTKLAFNHYWNDSVSTNVTAYYRNNSVKQNPSYRVKDDYKPWKNAGNPNLAHGEINDNAFDSYGLIAQHKQAFKFLNTSLIVGASLDYTPNTYKANYININKGNDGKYNSFNETDSLLADYNADILNTAGYLQAKVSPVKRLNIIGGLRYDVFNYQFDNKLDSNAFTAVLDGENNFKRFTPKIGATYNFKKHNGVYLNYSQGFVPPQVSELYRGNEIPTIKPVYYNSYEVGGWTTFAKEKAKIDISIYQMDGQNEIISVLQDDGSSVRQNAGKTTHKGIEYGLNTQIHRTLMLRVSGTNAIHEFVDYNEDGVEFSGNKLPLAPEWVINSQLTYKPNFAMGFRVSLEWQHIDEYFMESTNMKTYSGYDIINVRLGYTYKSVDFWLNVINANNQLYATVASASKWGESYSLGNPRNFNLGVGYKFNKNK